MLLVWKLQLIVLVSACSAGLVFCLFGLFKWVAVVWLLVVVLFILFATRFVVVIICLLQDWCGFWVVVGGLYVAC